GFDSMVDTSSNVFAFTRNPSTGKKSRYGEYHINAQGEDVVAGIRTPQELTEAARVAAGSEKPSLQTAMPSAFAQFETVCKILERHYRDMQDLEFTIERGKLWMLQTRSGKRTGKEAQTLKSQGKKTILVRVETSPEDIHGMHAAEGILTTRGGMTSHAAVVARGMGKPCVSGAGSIRVDYAAATLTAGGRVLKKGEI